MKSKRPIPAAGYVRMSSSKQERSPAQQRGEILKLAEKLGGEVVLWLSDEAITGDSGPEKRPAFKDMLAAAESGKFRMLLAENQDRIGRFDSLEGAQYFARLRKAGIKIVTCSDGPIDLDSFEGRLMNTIRQEGKHTFLRDLSRKVLRGQLANAKAGNSNGGRPRYALDRVLVNSSGEIIRQLQPGESVRRAGHYVRHVVGRDKHKLEAIRYMFSRFASSDISFTALACELTEKGYPGPTGNRWTHAAVSTVLRNPLYCGLIRWGVKSYGRYHTTQGDSIVPRNGQSKKPVEDTIQAANPASKIISPTLFAQVQRKVARRSVRKGRGRGSFPLSGLIYCGCCGERMVGATARCTGRDGKTQYTYRRYLCGSYNHWGSSNSTGCGCFSVKADAVQGWLIRILQEMYLGPGRDDLVDQIKHKLKAGSKNAKADSDRLQKRLTQTELEIGRLVKAIRTTDCPELTKELVDVR